jgi:cephalosporin hydroxylase
MALRRKIRNSLKRSAVRIFHLGQKCGVDITPRHFYSSTPDLKSLRSSNSWKERRSMAGVAGTGIEAQVEFLCACCPDAARAQASIADLVAYGTHENGVVGYGPVESAVLYCFISTLKPKRVIQVGAGYSTAIILRAAKESGYAVDLTCVDPFPTDYLRRLSRAASIKLLAEPAQDVAIDILTDLQAGDLFFLDSTHTVKVGSEVNRIVLEVFPRLPKGCFVQVHDIYFPYDYHRGVFTDTYFPGQSTLVHAYLTDNRRCGIKVALGMLHYARPDELRRLFPEYSPGGNDAGLRAPPKGHFPSALYLQMTGDPLA